MANITDIANTADIALACPSNISTGGGVSCPLSRVLVSGRRTLSVDGATRSHVAPPQVELHVPEKNQWVVCSNHSISCTSIFLIKINERANGVEIHQIKCNN